MDPFLSNAESILEAARASAQAHCNAGGWTILLGHRGEIEMLSGAGWTLESLRMERGAAMAYRVGERRGRLSVEGCAAGRECRLQEETPAAVARRLLANAPAYSLALPALPPAS